VGKALSIQAHPDKPHAEELHRFATAASSSLPSFLRDRPEVYKDPNHKPEIAIALTEFEGLCGFRPLAEIQAFLSSVPELAAAVGPAATAALAAASEADYTEPLREAFTALMQCDKQELGLHLGALTSRLGTCPQDDNLCELFQVSSLHPPLPPQRLHGQYRGDVGCFVIYFLNVLR
jgi:mannose-6-phosphate isomerase